MSWSNPNHLAPFTLPRTQTDPIALNTDDTFPSISSSREQETPFLSEDLTPLEKIYLYSRSSASFHRIFIIHTLLDNLVDGINDQEDKVGPGEAIEYVLPLLTNLAVDDEDSVKEALATELVAIIWWFYTHCLLVSESADFTDTSSVQPISVQAFTPILGTLLLSPSTSVSQAARMAVVGILGRFRDMDTWQSVRDREALGYPGPSYAPPPFSVGLFSHESRKSFEREIIHQVVIGMGKLDFSETLDEEIDLVEDLDDTALGGTDSYQISGPTTANGDMEPERTIGVRKNNDSDPTQPELSNMMDKGDAHLVLESSHLWANTSVRLPLSSNAKYDPLPNASSPVPREPEILAVAWNYPPVPYPPLSPLPQTPLLHVRLPRPTPDIPPILISSGSSSQLPDSELSPQVETPSRQNTSPLTYSPSIPRVTLPDVPIVSASLALTTNADSPSETLPHSSSSPLKRTSSLPRTTVPPDSGPSPLSIELPPTSAPSPVFPPTPAIPRRQNPTIPAGIFSTREPETSQVLPPEVEIDNYSQPDSECEPASVGRLASMSLISAVVSSAGNSLSHETTKAFVDEVERVSRDPVFWVRKEASFALGALAKVVPEEVLIVSLIPLFELLSHDATPPVRHASLYALPALLSRLPYVHRRTLALSTMSYLAQDASEQVRVGALESLGEVISSFHSNETPQELVNLFLGQSSVSNRALVIAFNYPAVAQTLGRSRWNGALRDCYLELTKDRNVRVRRTIAASLGEMARIVGKEAAERDLVHVWYDAIACDQDEVRLKVLECLALLLEHLGPSTRVGLVQSLIETWDTFGGWKERESVAKQLVEICPIVGGPTLGLVQKCLEDRVCAVRESAITALPQLWNVLDRRQLRSMILTLSTSEQARRRCTFVAAHQALFLGVSNYADALFWEPILGLARDTVVDVRIGVARLVGLALTHRPLDVMNKLVDQLNQDEAQVSAYLSGSQSSRSLISRPPMY